MCLCQWIVIYWLIILRRVPISLSSWTKRTLSKPLKGDLLVNLQNCLTQLGYIAHQRRNYSTLSWVKAPNGFNWEPIVINDQDAFRINAVRSISQKHQRIRHRSGIKKEFSLTRMIVFSWLTFVWLSFRLQPQLSARGSPMLRPSQAWFLFV